MTQRQKPLKIWQIMAWVLSFIVFAGIGYIYHWWSSDAQLNIQGFVSFGSVARVPRGVLEIMLITLVAMLLVGSTNFLKSQVQLQTAIRTYGVYLFIIFNPPMLILIPWLLPELGEAYILIFVPIAIILILELVATWYLVRPTFKKISIAVMALLTLPAAFWGLWAGFWAWSYRPAISITCQGNPNFQNSPEDFIRPSFNKWATRLEPVPKADSLPTIDAVRYLNIPVANELFTLCKDKKSFDFQAAHYDFWFELQFLAKDNYLYKAQIQAIQFEKSALQYLGSWQYQKIKQIPPRIIIKKSEMIIQHLEQIFKVIPELRKSSCLAFREQLDSKTRQTLAVLVADINERDQVKKMYLIRAKKIEQTWTPPEIAVSMQRISTRLGFGKVKNINWDIGSGPQACTIDKPYLGYQLFPERFFSILPSIGVTANGKRFDVSLDYTKDPAQLTVLSSQEPQVRSYEFLPTSNDIPWTEITTLEEINYTATPLLRLQKAK